MTVQIALIVAGDADLHILVGAGRPAHKGVDGPPARDVPGGREVVQQLHHRQEIGVGDLKMWPRFRHGVVPSFQLVPGSHATAARTQQSNTVADAAERRGALLSLPTTWRTRVGSTCAL